MYFIENVVMKIKDLKMHVFKTKLPLYVTSFSGLFQDATTAGTIEFSLIRVLTNEGIEGDYVVWGEVPYARPRSLAEVLSAIKPHLIGEDPLDHEKIWHKISGFWYGQKGPAFAAIDIALWDIAGKVANLPIYKLFGAYKGKVRAYASGNPFKSTKEIVNLAVKLKEKGYNAMKIHPISLEACKALREAMGDDVTLIHDAVFSYNRQEALRNGRELEKLNYYWYEAPLPSYDIEGYVELTKKLDIPITVELMGNYLEYIQRGAVDILRSISTFTGGITEMKKLAILSEMYGLKFEPHSYGGIFHQAATLQVILSAKNCEFFEVPIDKDGNEGMYDIGTKDKIRIDRDGYVHAPQKPGLGLEIDWKQVEEGSEIQL